MKVYCKNQNAKFDQHLNLLKEKVTTIPIDTNRKIEQFNLDFLFDYQIFPDHIMSFKTQ